MKEVRDRKLFVNKPSARQEVLGKVDKEKLANGNVIFGKNRVTDVCKKVKRIKLFPFSRVSVLEVF